MTSPLAQRATCSHLRQLMPWGDARRLAHQLPIALDAESVPLSAAAGRTLASPLHAAVMLPGFDNAAMDGYAVHGGGPWRLVGRAVPGHPGPVCLAVGEAVEVGTGTVLPAGTDRVVEYEAADCVDGIVRATPGLRMHIRRAGEYVQAGQEVLPAGRVLSAAAMGLAAGVGRDAVAVRKRPTVQLLVTGDELVRAGVPPHGRVRDAISPMITALLSNWGAEHLPTRWLPDTPPEALTAGVEASLRDADVIVVCGSSSLGPTDNLHTTLARLDATIHVNGVDCRPGHPQSLAQVGIRWLIGMPGNPYAALAAACTLLRPLLGGLLGQPLPRLPGAVLTGPFPPPSTATRLVPVRWRGSAAQIIAGTHPGHLGAAAFADALAVVPPQWRPENPVNLLQIS